MLQGDATYLIVNNEGAIEKYGLNAVCTHLGCVVPWNKVRFVGGRLLLPSMGLCDSCRLGTAGLAQPKAGQTPACTMLLPCMCCSCCKAAPCC